MFVRCKGAAPPYGAPGQICPQKGLSVSKRETRPMAVSLFLGKSKHIDAGRPWGPTRWGGAFAPYKCFRLRRKPWRGRNSLPASLEMSLWLPNKKTRFTACLFVWSRVRESNPPPRLGKPMYYRCTNPANEGYYIRISGQMQGENSRRRNLFLIAVISLYHETADNEEKEGLAL